jgi:hypothetical protein
MKNDIWVYDINPYLEKSDKLYKLIFYKIRKIANKRLKHVFHAFNQRNPK